MTKKPAWTYSQLDSFETCPRKFYHTKVIRDVVEPPSIHTEWGSKVHTALENYVMHGTPLPEGMTQWESLMQKITALPGEKLPEQKFALDRNFEPADWDNAWTRGIGDLVVLHKGKAAVLDYKTGKRKPSEQLQLYAAYVFAHYPQIETVTTGFVWLKPKRLDWHTIRQADVPSLWQAFLPRVAKLESAYERDSWPARPSGLCNGWCPITSCEFNKERKQCG
jgi:CRISPR/Cas system-associated exonuclease Cas4 (RecB family)